MDAEGFEGDMTRFVVDDLPAREIGPGTEVRTLWGSPGEVRALAVD